VAVSGAILVAVFLLRLIVDDPAAPLGVLFCIPVALLAIHFGVRGGLGGATAASAALVAWKLALAGELPGGWWPLLSRAATYFVIGGLVGMYATRSARALERARGHADETEGILRSTTDAIFRLGADGRCRYANPAVAEVLGWSPEEVRDRDLHALFHHSYADGAPYPHEACPVQRTLADGIARTGAGDDGEEVFWHKDGRPVIVDYNASPAGDGGVVVAMRDVSERAHNRERLRRYAARLTAVEGAPAPAPPVAGTRVPEPLAVRPPRTVEDTVMEVLELARQRLGMEIAFVGRFADGEETFPSVAGEGFDLQPTPLPETYCHAMASGRLPNVIADARNDERVADLATTAGLDIGAYLGVPIRLSDGRVYGALCTLSHDARPELGEHDVHLMTVLSTLVARELERREQEAEERRTEAGRAQEAIESGYVQALIAALETRDEYTGSHSADVVALASQVARHLGLPPRATTAVEQTALLHDIGKVGVPDAVLQKPGPLDELEWDVMRQHPAIGARLIEAIEPLAHLAPAIRAEHERWDGRGYPDGLRGQEIPIAARIGFACDAYHAMTSDRPYRLAMSEADAMAELRRHAGTQFDPAVVDALMAVLQAAHAR